MILFRGRDIILVMAMLGLATLTYIIKHEAQKQYAHIRQLENQIEAIQDTINLLKAEWALMSTPTRIATLVKHYESELPLEMVEPYQIATIDSLPPPVPDAIDLLIAEYIEPDLRPLITGSITP